MGWPCGDAERTMESPKGGTTNIGMYGSRNSMVDKISGGG